MLRPLLPQRPLPSPHQLALPFEEPSPSSPLTPLQNVTGISVRPRAVWRTLSLAQQEGTRQAFLRVATDLLREGDADEQRR
jgi:hypothetical protein